MSGELHARLDDRQLLLQALAAFAFGLSGLLFALDPASFVLAYMLQMWVVMAFAGTLMFWSDQKRKNPRPGAGASIVAAIVMFTFLWGVGVVLPMGTTWLQAIDPYALSPWPIIADAAPALGLVLPFFVLMAWQLAQRYEIEKATGRKPDTRTAIWHRVICLYAFILAGPFLYLLANKGLGAAWPGLAEARRLSFAIVFAYACCEAYPYVSAWMSRRKAAPLPTPPLDPDR